MEEPLEDALLRSFAICARPVFREWLPMELHRHNARDLSPKSL